MNESGGVGEVVCITQVVTLVSPCEYSQFVDADERQVKPHTKMEPGSKLMLFEFLKEEKTTTQQICEISRDWT